MPENSSVVETGKPVSTGTRNVAPNIAMTCCTPIAMVAPQARRSSGLTTLPGATVRPLPCRVQMGMRAPRGCGMRCPITIPGSSLGAADAARVRQPVRRSSSSR